VLVCLLDCLVWLVRGGGKVPNITQWIFSWRCIVVLYRHILYDIVPFINNEL
jgi:hypothetical protein